MKKIILNTVIFLLLAQVEIVGQTKRSGSVASTIIKKIKAALNWPTTYADKLVKARKIILKLTGNALFPLPWPTNIVALATLTDHVDDFEAALASGDAELEQSTETIVHNDLTNIMTMVQIKMDGNRPNAETICTGAGFDVGKEAPHGPRTNSIETGTEAGSAVLHGEGPGMHEWEISLNGGETSIHVRATTKGEKTIKGQQPKTKIWQRNSRVLPNEMYTEWTDWVEGETGG